MTGKIMSYNVTAYLIYGLLTYWIAVRTGWIFYRNGIHFIRAEICDEAVATSINNLLLGCYYLTNLGYITFQIWRWAFIPNFQTMLESLSQKAGFIILLLGVLHAFNMSVIYWLGKRNFHHS